MSKEFVKKFRKDLEENEELKENVKKELEAFKDSGKKEKELIPEIARRLGFDFTDDEFKEECTNSKKLNDEELANVSGGHYWLAEDAPDGHESECNLFWYKNIHEYYYKNRICENCGSKNFHDNVYGANEILDNHLGDIPQYYREYPARFILCKDCGHFTPSR